MKKQIPKKIVELLKERNISEESVIFFSESDMNREYEYSNGYILLTKESLIYVYTIPANNEVHCFRGTLLLNEKEEKDDRDFQITVYSLSREDRLIIEGQICCSQIFLKKQRENSDDEVIYIAACSNLHKKKMLELVRACEHRFIDDNEVINVPDSESDEYCPICGTMYPDKDRHICPKCMDRKSIFMRTLGYFKPYRAKLTVMLICYILTAALTIVWPYLNGKILYDKVLSKNDEFLARLGIENGNFITCLLIVVITMLLVKLFMLLIQILQGVFAAKIVTAVIRDLKKDIFNSMGKLSIGFFKSKQTGGLMTRVLSDAERVTGFFIDGVPFAIINLLIIVSTIIVMFTIKWQMAIIACIMIPMALFVSLKLRSIIWVLYGRRHRAERSLNSQINDNLTGARVVKAFGQEGREIKRFLNNNKRMKDSEISIVRFQNYNYLLYNAVQEVMSIIMWAIGVYFMLGEEHLELGIMITFVGYIGQLNGPMNFFSKVFQWWADSINSAQRMFEILDAIPEIKETDNPVILNNPLGEIELKNVTFGYSANRIILKDINLKINKGSMLGIVGRSGAGKTTLVNLISRMYDPQKGSILIDGIDVKQLAFNSLRKNVAMVSQETYIFMGTVEENIAYADSDASREDIIRAAKLASAHDFIMRMPDGYDTMIGSSGRELSGGERQRISIARAILADPKILILDEATASVDTETEQAIQKSIAYLIKGRTTISIAHRLSTLKGADSLIVIDNGTITERGTVDELTELKGTYYKLMELQTKALSIDGVM